MSPGRGAGGEQVQDFRLHRDVQGAGGLVQQQDARFQDQGPGDGHALALAAGKLVGIAVAVLGPEADFGKHLGDARLGAVEPWMATGMARIWSTVWRGCSEP